MLRNLVTAALLALSLHPANANTYASIEPIPSDTVLDIDALRAQPLAVRSAFAQTTAGCGFIPDVIAALSSAGVIRTINDVNTSFALSAGGFAGETNPSFVFTFIDHGPNAASHDDISVLTNSLAYVLSQASAFLLDADDPDAFDFPANYIVVNFPGVPSIEQSAALFERVGEIDPQLFATDTSGYTQYGRAYLSLQSAVDDAQFLAGYSEAAASLGLELTPVLHRGGAAFPGNDWTGHPGGEEYLQRIPAGGHAALAPIRDRHLRLTQRVLRFAGADHTGMWTRMLNARLSRAMCE